MVNVCFAAFLVSFGSHKAFHYCRHSLIHTFSHQNNQPGLIPAHSYSKAATFWGLWGSGMEVMPVAPLERPHCTVVFLEICYEPSSLLAFEVYF